MAVKVVTGQEKKKVPQYPYFGMSRTDGTVVYFTGERTGIGIGFFGMCVTWDESDFTPIEGPITFENVFEG